VISPDLRGFGHSPLPPEPYVDADDIAELLDHLGVADAAVVGCSMGGRVASSSATRPPIEDPTTAASATPRWSSSSATSSASA